MNTLKHMTLIKLSILIVLLAKFNDSNAQKFWLTTYNFPYGPKTALDLAHDSCLVGTINKVIRSCDEGYTWDSILGAPAIYSIKVTNNGRVLAGGSGKIYFTDNLGASWDSISLGHSYPVTKVIQHTNGDLYAITGTLDDSLGFVGAGVWFSANNGADWIARNNGLGSFLSCEQIASDKNGRIYLSVADENVSGNAGLFYSDNQGLQWQLTNIEVDGQNAIDGKIKIGNTRGLSISPEDSVHISISGTSVNVAVMLNITKHIDDIVQNNKWSLKKISNSNTWWLDRSLNNIYFSTNGDKYSSMNGSIYTGGTFFQKDEAINWAKITQGLGLDVSGNYGQQYFAQKKNGKVFMVQLLDERVYWADTSKTITTIKDDKNVNVEIGLFPNPAQNGNVIQLKTGTELEVKTVTIVDALGNTVERSFSGNENATFSIDKSGLFNVLIRLKNGKSVMKKIVVE